MRLGDWFRPRPDAVSEAWLKNQDRLAQRVEFHGVSIRFPINKARNDSAFWNSVTLKNRVG